MRRLRPLLAVLLASALFLPFATPAQPPAVKLGLLLPYTGVLSVQGTDTTNGLELYLGKIGRKARGHLEFDQHRQVISPIYITRVEKQAGRYVNLVIERIPSVRQEDVWGWWTKR